MGNCIRLRVAGSPLIEEVMGILYKMMTFVDVKVPVIIVASSTRFP